MDRHYYSPKERKANEGGCRFNVYRVNQLIFKTDNNESSVTLLLDTAMVQVAGVHSNCNMKIA